jgi:ATP-dependent protease ClpP protease subunit
MDFQTRYTCYAASDHLGRRLAPDVETLRIAWTRARTWREVVNGDNATAAALAAPPGQVAVVPFRQSPGLALRFDGELVPGGFESGPLKAIRETSGKVTISINSGGGDILGALRLYDVLMASARPIETYALGVCGSAALLLFLAGQTRKVYKRCQLYTHAATSVIWGNASDLRLEAERLDGILPRLTDAYQRCVSDHALVRQWLTSNDDFFFTADQSLQLGLATEVLTEPEMPQ